MVDFRKMLERESSQVSMIAIFSCNECGKESAHGRFKGHRSGMGSTEFICLACDEKHLHTFVRYENEDAEPSEVTPGETDFAYGANVPEETDGPLLAFEDLSDDVKKAIQEKRNKKMIVLQEAPKTNAQTQRGVQFLKPIHVNEEGTVATIYKATSDVPDNYSNPYVVYFEMGGQKYSKGFSGRSQNLRDLCALLGTDEAKWKGKQVRISLLKKADGGEQLGFSKATK